jgi:hypothetical protein
LPQREKNRDLELCPVRIFSLCTRLKPTFILVKFKVGARMRYLKGEARNFSLTTTLSTTHPFGEERRQLSTQTDVDQLGHVGLREKWWLSEKSGEWIVLRNNFTYLK